LCSIAAQYTISNKVAQLHAAPHINREALPDVIIQDTEEGAEDSNKRCKQRCLETTTTTDDDGGIIKQGDNIVVERIATIACSGEH
jgi:hypothetical protein